MNFIHRTKVGTYHPDPKSEIAWTVHDSRGYLDGGPACDECGACECTNHGPDCDFDCDCAETCIGLSFAYVCLNGGDTLCQECFDKDGSVKVVDCDCG